GPRARVRQGDARARRSRSRRSLVIDVRSIVKSEMRPAIFFSLHTAKDDRECARVDACNGPMRDRRLGQMEPRAMETFVEDAVAVSIKPENLEAVAAAVCEHEECPTLRILFEALLDLKRERVERPAHILPLGTHEDAHRLRNHTRRSRTSSNRRSAAA